VSVEAEYACCSKKTIIPLRVEADYKPTGWLGQLCANENYDFSNQAKTIDELSKLQTKLKELQPAMTNLAQSDNSRDTGLTAVS